MLTRILYLYLSLVMANKNNNKKKKILYTTTTSPSMIATHTYSPVVTSTPVLTSPAVAT